MIEKHTIPQRCMVIFGKALDNIAVCGIIYYIKLTEVQHGPA